MRKSLVFVFIILSILTFSKGVDIEMTLYPNQEFVLGYNLGKFSIYGDIAGIYAGDFLHLIMKNSLSEYMNNLSGTAEILANSEDDILINADISIYGYLLTLGAGVGYTLLESEKSELELLSFYDKLLFKEVGFKAKVNDSYDGLLNDLAVSLNKELDNIDLSRIRIGIKAKYKFDNAISIFAKYGFNLSFLKYNFEVLDTNMKNTLIVGYLYYMGYGVEMNF